MNEKINTYVSLSILSVIILVTLTRRNNGDVPNISTMHLHIFAKKLLVILGNPMVSIPIRCASIQAIFSDQDKAVSRCEKEPNLNRLTSSCENV